MPPRRKFIRQGGGPAYNKYQQAKKRAAANKSKMARIPFNQRVTSAIARAQETKLVIAAPYNYNNGNTLENFTQFSTAITGTSELYNLIPAVTVGDDDYQRVGNQIQPTKLTVSVQCALGGIASSQIYVDFFFLHAKAIKDARQTANIQIQKLLNDGQGQNVPYDGTSFTAMLPLNKTEFTMIKHVRVLLKKPYGDPQGLYSGAGIPPASVSSLPASTKTFSVTIKLPKKLTYEQRTDYVCTNTFPFMAVGFTAADQFGGTALTPTLPVYVQAQSHLFYKDA
jgi:hypothetical protein